MSTALSDDSDEEICRLCRYTGCDLRLEGCGCTIHARCAPLCLVLELKSQTPRSDYGTFPVPASVGSILCPCCKAATITGLYLLPLSFRGLEKAIELRKSCALAAAKATSGVGQIGKRPREEEHEIHAESSYVILSNSKGSMSGSGLSDREQQRTGRWTDEEIAYVDYMVSAFDQGSLPLPHGIKLNEFLGDMLLCKSSRLTKKMKNAKLSTRSFKLSSPDTIEANHNCEVLSSLQEKFLMTLPSEATQLELRFNITKQWRKHFSNLCLQVGYTGLNSTDWISSLEEMERRASSAEDNIRRVRRRRMGLALRTDSGISSPGVFIGGVPTDASSATSAQTVLSSDLASDSNNVSLSKPLDDSANQRKLETSHELPERAEQDFLQSMVVSSANNRSQSSSSDQRRGRARTFSEDFDAVLSDLMGPEPDSVQSSSIATCTTEHSSGPFLDAIVMYLEQSKLPFHHVDVWVPSFLPQSGAEQAPTMDSDQLRLFHAGHATRGDLTPDTAFRYEEFGSYSSKFSFQPGHGLPGRVYSTGKMAWERGLNESDPKEFERVGGCKVYGVKTALGIPLNTPMVGRIIIALYSCEDVPEDQSMANNCLNELSNYSPEPKWKLVIEMKTDDKSSPDRQASGSKGFTQGSSRGSQNTFPGLHVSRQKPPFLPGSPVPETTLSATTGKSRSGYKVQRGDGESNVDSEEQHIVSLLGDHMPITDDLSNSSTQSLNKLLPHFMSIRLLLLRPERLRKGEEKEMIDILKSSYRAYAKDNRHNGAELATLLAKEWICLKSTYNNVANAREAAPAPARTSTSNSSSSNESRKEDNHQSHVMQPLLEPASLNSSGSWPNQSISRNTSTMGVFGYDIEGSNNFKNTSNTMGPPRSGVMRRASFDPSLLERRTSFEPKPINQRIANINETPPLALQPMVVNSSHVDDSPKPLAPKPNVVLEH